MSTYLSTVAKSGQVNTPPGSYGTVREWAQQSFLTPHSYVLEVGCTTGFITIELARYTGARTVGIDLHEKSIERARENADSSVKDRVLFQHADAGKLPFDDNTFSHVVISGHLPFIPHELRTSHIREALRVLRPWGHLLVALYYYKIEPPAEFVGRFNERVGTSLRPEGNRAYWAGLFENMPATLEYERDYEVSPANPKRVEAYLAQLKDETRSDWKEIVRLFNENGQYLAYFVQVHRKIPDEQDLMIQIPRGGLYETRER